MSARRFAFALPLLPLLAAAPARAAWVTDGLPVCTAANQQVSNRSAADALGGALIAWQDRRGTTGYDIYAQKLLSAGTPAAGWPANGVALCTQATDQTDPVICTDDAGGALVAWVDHRLSSAGDIFGLHVTAGGTVAAGWSAGGNPLCVAEGAQSSPAIVSDGAGGAIVVWQDHRDGLNDHLAAVRVHGDGTLAEGWSVDGNAVTVALGNAVQPQIVTDGAAGAFVAWLDDREGKFSQHVYAQHMTADGSFAAGWEIGGLGVCVAEVSQSDVRMIADGAGGAILTWTDLRAAASTGADVYAQRVGDPASVAWTPQGVLACGFSGDQTTPAIAPDGAGGALIAWCDNRSGPWLDIYAQHVDTTGARRWATGGVPVCTATNDQAAPVMIPDGAGGAVIAWLDLRDSFTPDNPYDVYALRIDSAGARPDGWTSDGVALCTAFDVQRGATIVSDHAGGAIVTWDDRRGGSTYDIYAQRVGATGASGPAVGVDTAPPGARARLRPPAPNPSRGRTMVSFDLPAAGRARVEVLDPAGRVVRRLASGRLLSAGAHDLAWDGRDERGRRVPAGLYLVRLEFGGSRDARRIVVLD